AFFAEDVHRLASASVDGRIYVWKIDEGPDEENKPQITGKIEMAIQIVGDAGTYHPRICWHSHKQVEPHLYHLSLSVSYWFSVNDLCTHLAGNSVCWNRELCLKNRHNKSGKRKR
uniref:Uncharacterized protein n=1 Tax=Aegilops tauschii subsp. strangulata TaxID=200361 RepID=A0A453RDX6_AEGTS